MKSAVLVLALVCGPALAGADDSSRAQITPTQKVIDLLNAMLEKGKEDKNAEGVQFAAYKQFCDDTSTEKNRAITEAEELLASLKADIEKYSADARRLEKEVAGHDADIAAWTGDENAATKVRQLEKADYDKTHKDYSESVDALGRAIAVLNKQLSESKTTSDQGSFVQVAGLKELSLIPPEAKRAIDAFLSQDLNLNEEEAMDAAPEASAYEFQSNHIIEMLEKLQSKFVDEKTNLEKEEAESVHAYKMLMQDLAAQIGAGNDDVKEKTEFRTSCLEKKAECEGNVADTTNTKKADEKYVADLTATCKTKSSDFESRQELRAGEIEAIEKAIEILSDDSVSGAAERHLPALVQGGPKFLKVQGDHLVSSLAQLRSDSVSINQARVVKFLQKQADALHSRLLTVISERAASDPFQKVKKMISDLIDKLQAEASEEADQKGFCDQELATNEQTRKEKTAAAETTHAEIDELTATIAILTDEIGQLTEDNSKTQEAMTEATTIRQEEKAKNTQTIAESKEAQKAVARAMTVLKEFYAKAAGATAFAQEPEIFNSPYKGMGSENGGVVGMLEVIESDFARLEADTSASEAAAQKEYDGFMDDSNTAKRQNQKDIEHKTAKKQDKNQSLILAREDLEGTQEELSAALEEYDKLKQSCLDSGVDYEDRVARRKQELESLQQALQILNGEDI